MEMVKLPFISKPQPVIVYTDRFGEWVERCGLLQDAECNLVKDAGTRRPTHQNIIQLTTRRNRNLERRAADDFVYDDVAREVINSNPLDLGFPAAEISCDLRIEVGSMISFSNPKDCS